MPSETSFYHETPVLNFITLDPFKSLLTFYLKTRKNQKSQLRLTFVNKPKILIIFLKGLLSQCHIALFEPLDVRKPI